ncbi:WD40 repeat-like protein [Gymnopus androsaceus JB14]|uniref:WD40 repeat-like protein n=1 Tax=Gymnopus androsaceus JB14 TaxID=1447944 RepID=A0A6A4HEA8_9AGAR|nr:WD40 repeat-like protein [Gymnopus androsaceus JB14]
MSLKGILIQCCAHDQTVRVWDTFTGKIVHVLEGHTGSVWSVVYSGDNHKIASGSVDGTVHVWGAKSGQGLDIFRGHTGTVLSVRFSPDSRRLISVSANGIAHAWDTTEEWKDGRFLVEPQSKL